eukprot:4854735-Prorocentrum_lima.AAC.1
MSRWAVANATAGKCRPGTVILVPVRERHGQGHLRLGGSRPHDAGVPGCSGRPGGFDQPWR